MCMHVSQYLCQYIWSYHLAPPGGLRYMQVIPYIIVLADIEFRTGVHVSEVDVSKKSLSTADGESITYENLIIAVGARVRS